MAISPEFQQELAAVLTEVRAAYKSRFLAQDIYDRIMAALEDTRKKQDAAVLAQNQAKDDSAMKAANTLMSEANTKLQSNLNESQQMWRTW